MDEARVRQRVLVVDDDVSIRLMLTRVLQREDFEVESARDGLEAIEKLKLERFDVIFLDLMMPRLDGMGVVRYLRANDPESLRSIIVVTAFPSVSDEMFRDEPVAKVMAKPFDIQSLVAGARQLIGEVATWRAGASDSVQPS
jgi:DNA-binding response OmpR family regulator